jgi:hypothetical protein
VTGFTDDDELAAATTAALSQDCRRLPPVAAFGARPRLPRRGRGGVAAPAGVARRGAIEAAPEEMCLTLGVPAEALLAAARAHSSSSGMFSTWPHALQCTASASWRSSPHCGQGWRTLPPGRNAACARRKNSEMPTIIIATESSSPEVLPSSVMSPKPVVESAATVK